MKKTILWVGLSVVCLSPASAQSQTLASERRAFEAASIRPHPANGGPIRVLKGVDAGGIQYRSVTLLDCIIAAYGLPRYQISGGPSWLGSDRYDITATSAAAPKAQLMLMLQTLLEDRFQLKIHRETKDLPVYALVVGRNGLKMKPGKDGGATAIGGDGHLIDSRGITMKFLADVLTQITQGSGRPILDMTGLDGVFDITVDFASDDLNGNNISDPDIFAAVQSLGLKLEPRKTAFEILVIDHAEKPSEN